METATDTLNEFNSANKYGDAFGLDAGKIADGIKGFGSKPAEKETTKEPEGKAENKESEKGENGDSAKDFIDAAKKVAEIQGSEAETVATEEKPLSRGEELRQKYGHLSPEERKALLAKKIEENRERKEKEGQEQERAEQTIAEDKSEDRSIPQGLSYEQFAWLSQTVKDQLANISQDIRVQGSRAAWTARENSDIDIAVLVSADDFDILIEKYFGTPNPRSSKERTKLWAIKTGKIQAGEFGARGLRKQIEKKLGIEVDLSIVKINGDFDNPPYIHLI